MRRTYPRAAVFHDHPAPRLTQANRPPRNPAQISLEPPLSDASAVEILEFLHELVLRFEAHYFGQIRRLYNEQRRLFTRPPFDPSLPDDDVPFCCVSRWPAIVRQPSRAHRWPTMIRHQWPIDFR